MVSIKLVGPAAQLAGAKELTIEIDEPTPINQLLPRELKDNESYILLVNQETKSWDQRVKQGDEVIVLPPIGGG